MISLKKQPQAVVRIVKCTWLLLSVMVLLYSAINFDGKPNSDIDIFIIYAMLVLSFPSGLAAAALMSAVAYVLDSLFGVVTETSLMSMFVTWFVFLAFGYFQWFVFVPLVMNRMKPSK